MAHLARKLAGPSARRGQQDLHIGAQPDRCEPGFAVAMFVVSRKFLIPGQYNWKRTYVVGMVGVPVRPDAHPAVPPRPTQSRTTVAPRADGRHLAQPQGPTIASTKLLPLFGTARRLNILARSLYCRLDGRTQNTFNKALQTYGRL